MTKVCIKEIPKEQIPTLAMRLLGVLFLKLSDIERLTRSIANANKIFQRVPGKNDSPKVSHTINVVAHPVTDKRV
jgi:hypothetical protein